MEIFNQYAALPFVIRSHGVEVLLATSKDTGRWVLPKGWHKDPLSPMELVALEAYEEVGVKGSVSDTPIGSYRYKKRLHFFSRVTCQVDVYPLHVDHHLIDWPEKDRRSFDWFSPEDAARRLNEVGLPELVEQFAHSYQPLLHSDYSGDPAS